MPVLAHLHVRPLQRGDRAPLSHVEIAQYAVNFLVHHPVVGCHATVMCKEVYERQEYRHQREYDAKPITEHQNLQRYHDADNEE